MINTLTKKRNRRTLTKADRRAAQAAAAAAAQAVAAAAQAAAQTKKRRTLTKSDTHRMIREREDQIIGRVGNGIQYQPPGREAADKRKFFFKNTPPWVPDGPPTGFAGNLSGARALAATTKKPSFLRRAWRRISGKGGRRRTRRRRKRRKTRRKTRRRRGGRRKISRRRTQRGGGGKAKFRYKVKTFLKKSAKIETKAKPKKWW